MKTSGASLSDSASVSSLLAVKILCVSDDAEEWVGRIVGSSSVDPSKSVPASLAVSDAAVEYVLEYEPDDRRKAARGPTCGV